MILITGAAGQLGKACTEFFSNNKIMHCACDIEEFDITNKEETYQFIKKVQPESIIHCAAFTSVDAAENKKADCYNTNVIGTKNISQVCSALNIKILYISTDYVFDGKKESPYEIDDMPNPKSYYGLTKYLGEEMVKAYIDKFFIVRISWLYGGEKNFVNSILKQKDRHEIQVVSNQSGSPTNVYDLVPLLYQILCSEKYGIYHASNEGYCTFFDWAKEILLLVNSRTTVLPILYENYESSVARPKNSMLSKTSLDIAGFQRLPRWQISLKKYLDNRENTE